MPELPEVETTLRGIKPHFLGKKITVVHIRHHQLRWPIPQNIAAILQGKTLQKITRRAKYLLLTFNHGTLIIHLGMSGKLSVVANNTSFKKHDHCDFVFDKLILRYHDPRRFGAILWTDGDPLQHSLLKNLGPEPLSRSFNAKYLYRSCQHKKANIKSIIMNSQIVVGVGNIYANEALFLVGIHPAQSARSLNLVMCEKLVQAIKTVLRKSIKAGGTTLRDFLQADGKLGYFAQQLQVYGRKNLPCFQCQQAIILLRQQQRATYFCAKCQNK